MSDGDRVYTFPRPYLLNGCAFVLWCIMFAQIAPLMPDTIWGAGLAAFFLVVNANLGLRALIDGPLAIDADGFTYRALLRRRNYKWEDVTAFSVELTRTGPEVAFDYSGAPYALARDMFEMLRPRWSIPLAVVGVNAWGAVTSLNAYRSNVVSTRLYEDV